MVPKLACFLMGLFILEFLFTSRIVEKDSEELAEVKALKAENDNLVKQIDEQSQQIQMMSQPRLPQASIFDDFKD